MSSSGLIREARCYGHTHVEWDVAYTSLPEDYGILRSPTFKFGTQEYIMQLQEVSVFRVELKLLRTDLSASDGVRCFMGVKRGDGSYHHEIAIEGTDKETSTVCTKSLLIRCVEILCLDPDGNLSFFVRMNAECTQEGLETCNHDEITTSGTGLIREEECIGHKYFEWNVKFDKEVDEILSSPEFMIGSQRYLLELSDPEDIFVLRLFRIGSSEEHPVHCIAGMKRYDDSYDHIVQSGDLKLLDKCEMWKCMGTIYSADTLGIERLLCAEGKVTFFVRMTEDRTWTGAQMCNHARMIPSGEGRIREQKCSDHIQVEWDLENELLQEDYYTVTCPVFEIESHLYLMELRDWEDEIDIQLFRTSRTSKSRYVRFFLGAKRGDSSYFPKTKSGVLDQEEDCRVWKPVNRILILSTTVMRSELLSSDGQLTLFVRIYIQQTPSGPKTCIHDAARMIPSGEGRIREQKCSDHIQVEWDLENALLQEYYYTLTCPVFEIESHLYLKELRDWENEIDLRLFRIGRTSKRRCVRFFLGAKRGDSSYCPRTESGVLDQEEACRVWPPVNPILILSTRSELLSSNEKFGAENVFTIFWPEMLVDVLGRPYQSFITI